jgi:hypothetical protein
VTLSNASAPRLHPGAIGHEVFEDKAALAALQRSAATATGDFAVVYERVSLDSNHFVMCAAVWAVEWSCRMFRHSRVYEPSTSRFTSYETMNAVFRRLFPILAMVELLLAAHGAVADCIRFADVHAGDASGQQKRKAHSSHCLA